jgi:hypothetical protein
MRSVARRDVGKPKLENRHRKKTPDLAMMILGITYDMKLEADTERRDAESETQMRPIKVSGRYLQRLWQTEAEHRDANRREDAKRRHMRRWTSGCHWTRSWKFYAERRDAESPRRLRTAYEANRSLGTPNDQL